MELAYREPANLKLTLKQLSGEAEQKVPTAVNRRPRNPGRAHEPHPSSSAELLIKCSSSGHSRSYCFTANYASPQHSGWRENSLVKLLWGFPGGSVIKNPPLSMQETWVRALGWEGLLDKEVATHSSVLAWGISRTEGPGGLQSWGCKELATEVVIKRSSWDKPLVIPINDRSDVPNVTTHPGQLPFGLTFQVQILQHTNMPIHV